MGHSPPRSSVHAILQARILEWVAVFFWKGSSQPRDGTCVSCIAGGFFFTCWIIREAQAKPWSKLIQDVTKSFFNFLGPLIFHILEEKEGIEFCLLWIIRLFFTQFWGFFGGSEGKASARNTRNSGLIPGWGRSPGERNSNALQYPCLENPMDGEAS